MSENAAFADAVVAAGIIWIGPTGSSIREIGDKVRRPESSSQISRSFGDSSIQAAAKAFLTNNTSIALVPGYSGSDQTLQTLLKEARSIGYPLLIKASAGGGGKGMRIIHEEST